MTPSQLKSHVEDTGSHYFDRKTLSFFGNRMSNYGVRSEFVKKMINDVGIVMVEVWELYRKSPVKFGNQSSTFFNKTSFKVVYNDPEV